MPACYYSRRGGKAFRGRCPSLWPQWAGWGLGTFHENRMEGTRRPGLFPGETGCRGRSPAALVAHPAGVRPVLVASVTRRAPLSSHQRPGERLGAQGPGGARAAPGWSRHMGALLPGRLWHLPSVEHMSPIDTYTSQKGPAHTHRHDKHRRQVLRAKMSHPSICMTPKGSLREEGVTSKGRASRPGACVRGVVWATQVSSGGLRACRNMLVCVRVHVCACMPVYMHRECFCTRVCVFVPVCVCVCVYAHVQAH